MEAFQSNLVGLQSRDGKKEASSASGALAVPGQQRRCLIHAKLDLGARAAIAARLRLVFR